MDKANTARIGIILSVLHRTTDRISKLQHNFEPMQQRRGSIKPFPIAGGVAMHSDQVDIHEPRRIPSVPHQHLGEEGSLMVQEGPGATALTIPARDLLPSERDETTQPTPIRCSASGWDCRVFGRLISILDSATNRPAYGTMQENGYDNQASSGQHRSSSRFHGHRRLIRFRSRV